MPRDTTTFDRDPKRFVGLTARRTAKGLPVGPIAAAPLEWWQAAETETVANLDRLRREGRI